MWGIAVKFYGSGAQWPTIYNYNKAVIIATAQAHGFTSDFSHWIFPGEVLKIPGVGGTTVPAVPVAPAVTKYLMTYTSAHWELNTIPAPDPLSPDQLQRTWVTDGDQVVGFTTANLAVVQDPAIVILGEEGRVCDWNPIRDGYGRYKTEQLYRTISGITRYEGAGWYPQSWDVPAQTFELSSDIDWPEGREYLLKYLTKHNREITVQTFKVVNRDNLWSKIERGAIVNLNATLQGPQPGGISLVIRVIAFSPDEYAGYMDIVGEVYA